jgi:hypothetical protein
MARLIKDLQLTEVSSVDRGAGEGCEIVFMKQEADVDVIQKAQQMPERQMIAFCKTDGISKQQLSVLIDDLAQAKRERGESREQAFSKFVCDDPLGQGLFSILKSAA